MYVHVVNPLRCPATVASNIDIIMEVCGSDDLEFHVPASASMSTVVAQSGGDAPSRLASTTTPLYDGDVGGTSEGHMEGVAQYTIGEHVTSLLQLCKRYTRITGTYGNPGLGMGNTLHLNPFYFGGWVLKTADPATITPPAIGGDMLSLFSSFYAFSRGGVRLRMAAVAPGVQQLAWVRAPKVTTSWIQTIQPNPFFEGNLQVFYKNNGACSPCIQPLFDGGCSIQVPAYSKLHTRVNAVHYSDADVQPDQPDVSVALANVNTAGTSFDSLLLRAAADDFQFSYWIGIPDLIFW